MTSADRERAVRELAVKHKFAHWHVDMNAPNFLILEDGSGKMLAKCFDIGNGWTADAIQQAVNAVPFLLAALDEARAAPLRLVDEVIFDLPIGDDVNYSRGYSAGVAAARESLRQALAAAPSDPVKR